MSKKGKPTHKLDKELLEEVSDLLKLKNSLRKGCSPRSQGSSFSRARASNRDWRANLVLILIGLVIANIFYQGGFSTSQRPPFPALIDQETLDSIVSDNQSSNNSGRDRLFFGEEQQLFEPSEAKNHKRAIHQNQRNHERAETIAELKSKTITRKSPKHSRSPPKTPKPAQKQHKKSLLKKLNPAAAVTPSGPDFSGTCKKPNLGNTLLDLIKNLEKKDPKKTKNREKVQKEIQLFFLRTSSGVEWIHINATSKKKCGMSMGMNVGSFQEIEGDFYEGTAHLLEHSIFLKETPEVKANYPYWNGATTDQETFFYAETRSDLFKEGFKYKIDELMKFEPSEKIKDEVFAVNNEFQIGIVTKTWKLELITKQLIDDPKSPKSRFNAGNYYTLHKPDIPAKVGKFYSKFYSLNKFQVVTVCEIASKQDLKNLVKSIPNSSERKINTNLPPATHFPAPKISHNRLVLIEHQTEDFILMTKYINYSELQDGRRMDFYLTLFEAALDKVLFREKKLVEGLSAGYSRSKNFFTVQVQILPNNEGKKRLRPIIESVNAVLGDMKNLVTRRLYNQLTGQRDDPFAGDDEFADIMDAFVNGVHERKEWGAGFTKNSKKSKFWEKFSHLVKNQKLGEVVGLDVSSVGEKYLDMLMTYGLDNVGDEKFKKFQRFNKRKFAALMAELETSNAIYAVIGNFKVDEAGKIAKSKIISKRERLAKEKAELSKKLPTTAEVLKGADLSKKFTLDDLLDKRLVDYSFLGITGPKGEPAEPGVVVLDYTHPIYGINFGYINLPSISELKNDAKAKIDFQKKNAPTTDPDTLLVESVDARKLFCLQSEVTEVKKVNKRVTTKMNQKYPLNAISVYFNLYAKPGPSKEVNQRLNLVLGMWIHRLKKFNDLIKNVGSEITFGVDNGEVDIGLDVAVPLLDAVAKKVLKTISTPFSKKEVSDYLQKLYTKMTQQEELMGLSFSKFSDFAKSKAYMTQAERIKYIQSLRGKTISAPEFSVGKVFVEGFVNQKIVDYLEANFAKIVDKGYNGAEEFDTQPYQYQLRGFGQKKVNVLAFKNPDQDNLNRIVSHIFLVGDITDDLKSANIEILAQIMNDQIFDYIRTEKKLGYVSMVQSTNINKKTVLIVFVQTTEPKRARRELENYYRVVKKNIEKMDPGVFAELKTRFTAEEVQKFRHLSEEAVKDWARLEGEVGLDYHQRMNRIYAEKVTKESVLALFEELMADSKNRKVVIDSGFEGAGAGKKYAVENPYTPGEEFVVNQV